MTVTSFFRVTISAASSLKRRFIVADSSVITCSTSVRGGATAGASVATAAGTVAGTPALAGTTVGRRGILFSTVALVSGSEDRMVVLAVIRTVVLAVVRTAVLAVVLGVVRTVVLAMVMAGRLPKTFRIEIEKLME